jgi:hypothetical protein
MVETLSGRTDKRSEMETGEADFAGFEGRSDASSHSGKA